MKKTSVVAFSALSCGLMAVATTVFGNQQGLIGMMKPLGVELLTLKFGREQETEADLTGLLLLQLAKIDPAGMITFFERLSEKDEGRMEWLSTHPMSAARADRLKAELAAYRRKRRNRSCSIGNRCRRQSDPRQSSSNEPAERHSNRSDCRHPRPTRSCGPTTF